MLKTPELGRVDLAFQPRPPEPTARVLSRKSLFLESLTVGRGVGQGSM